jgi:hypothetical protein
MQPPPPELPNWRVSQVSHTNRVRAFHFLKLNTTTHLVEPDREPLHIIHQKEGEETQQREAECLESLLNKKIKIEDPRRNFW